MVSRIRRSSFFLQQRAFWPISDIFYESENICDCRIECRWNDYELSISYSTHSAEYIGEMAAAIGFKNGSWLEYVHIHNPELNKCGVVRGKTLLQMNSWSKFKLTRR